MSSKTYTQESLSSYELTLQSLYDNDKRRVLDHLDYSSFSNFITLGSAEFAVNSAINEILDAYPTYEKFGASITNLSITTNDEFVSEYLSWKFKSEPFTEYLANDIKNSAITATITGASYASTSADLYQIIVPFFQRTSVGKSYYFNDNTVVSNITSWSTSAVEFDQYNMNMICNFLPDIMTQRDEEFDTLIRTIGKQFDYLYLSTKDMNNIYAGEYQLNKLPSDYVLNQFIESLGFSKLYDFTERNLIDYYQAVHGTEYNRKDLSRYFKAAFVNNISQVIKTKGTRESIKTLQNIFGWPEDLIQIEEYITVSDKIPSSGMVISVPEYKQSNDIMLTQTSPYCFETPDLTTYTSLTSSSFSGSPHGVIFSFSLSGIQNLRSKTGFWSGSQEKCLLEIQTTNAAKTKRNYLCFIARSAASGFHLRNYTAPGHAVASLSGVWNIAFTDSKYAYTNDNTIFTIGFNLAKNNTSASSNHPVFGTYLPPDSIENAKYNPNSITSSSTGSYIYEITDPSGGRTYTAYDTDFIEKITIAEELIPGFSPLSLKIYNAPLWTTATKQTMFDTIKPHIDDYNYFKRTYGLSLNTNDVPKKWYKFNNTSSTSIADSSNSSLWNNIPLTSASGGTESTLVRRSIFSTKNYTYYSGECIDEIGIYVDNGDNNISNYLLANNKLKIQASPTHVINNLIKNILNNYNIDSLYGNPDDIYKSSYSKLTELRGIVYSFLATYSDSIDVKTFFDVLKQQYPENIIRFILEHLVPAKSNAEGGVILESDILDENKYAWKMPESEEINREDSIKKDILTSSNILDESILLNKTIVKDVSEQSIESDDKLIIKSQTTHPVDESNSIYNLKANTDLIHDEFNYIQNILKESILITDDEVIVSGKMKTDPQLSYEDKYLSAGIWGTNDSQGNETDIHSITGLFKYGETQSSSNWIINNAYEEKVAHSDISQLNLSWNKTELNDDGEIGTLNLSLTRYGNETPNGIVKLIVPSRSETDTEPVITFSNIYSLSGDIGYPSLTAGKELFIKLGKDGFRHLNYTLNIPDTSMILTNTNAYAAVDFGDLGPSAANVSMTVIGSGQFLEDAGNLLTLSIVEDPTMHTTYAKCEIIKNKNIKISVIEVPYVVYNIIDALTSSPDLSNYVSINLADLYMARDSSTADTDWMSRTVGEFKLKNGSGNLSTIKNKEYKIQALNIYNNEQKEFSITPRVFTIAVDENKPIKETT